MNALEPVTGLYGPHPLNNPGIDAIVSRTGLGVYAVGRVNQRNAFQPRYVGRDDKGLNRRLHEHLNEGYTHYTYGFYNSPEVAFEKECQLFHDLTELLVNKIHPGSPNGMSLSCPHCGHHRH